MAHEVEDMIDDLLHEMEVSEVPASNTVSVQSQLNGECTIYTIGECYQKLKQVFNEQRSHAIDLSAVTEADSSFIQLLASLKQHLEAQNQTLEILNCPEHLRHKIQALHMAAYFGLSGN